MTETWRPVLGRPRYEVSDEGRIRCVRDGKAKPPRKPASPGPCGFRTTPIYVRGRVVCHRIGDLVAEAFIGPKPYGAQVRHLDGNPLNDRLDNLAYGTVADVLADHAARARREEAAGAPTHCPRGHEYRDSWLGNFGNRFCLGCTRDSPLAREIARRKADKRRVGPRGGSCVDCGADVQPLIGGGTVARRCLTCTPLYNREQKRQKYRDDGLLVGVRTGTCGDCGEPVEPRVGPGALATRCPACHLAARREAGRAHDAKRRAEGRRAVADVRPCIDCGAPATRREGVIAGPVPSRCLSCSDAAQREAARVRHLRRQARMAAA